MTQQEHLVRMANQIAQNFERLGEAEAARETASHIKQFWDPRMKKALAEKPEGLSAIATQALVLV